MNMHSTPIFQLDPWRGYVECWRAAIDTESRSWADDANLLFIAFHLILGVPLLLSLVVAAYFPCRQHWSRIPLQVRLAAAIGAATLSVASAWLFWIKTSDLRFNADMEFAVAALFAWRVLGTLLSIAFATLAAAIADAARRSRCQVEDQ